MPFAIYFFRAYFAGVPRELTEAARVGGASEAAIFPCLMLPLARPAMVTVAIIYVVRIFKDFVWPLAYLSNNDVRPVTLGMMSFQGQHSGAATLQTAALPLATLPPVVVFLVCRRRIRGASWTGRRSHDRAARPLEVRHRRRRARAGLGRGRVGRHPRVPFLRPRRAQGPHRARAGGASRSGSTASRATWNARQAPRSRRGPSAWRPGSRRGPIRGTSRPSSTWRRGPGGPPVARLHGRVVFAATLGGERVEDRSPEALALAAWTHVAGVHEAGRGLPLLVGAREVAAAGEVPAPAVPARVLPTAPPGPGRFGAFYAHLKHHDALDRRWRVGAHPDVAVRFGDEAFRLILWRGTNCLPCWASADGIRYTDEFNETWGHGATGCAAPMADRRCACSHVRIIESSDARRVVHRRCALVVVRGVRPRKDPVTGWTDFTDEVHAIYPDGTGPRVVTLHSSQPLDPHELQETLLVMGPGQRPEDVPHPEALTMADMAGDEHASVPGRAAPRLPSTARTAATSRSSTRAPRRSPSSSSRTATASSATWSRPTVPCVPSTATRCAPGTSSPGGTPGPRPSRRPTASTRRPPTARGTPRC